jgi:hypothetical protein
MAQITEAVSSSKTEVVHFSQSTPGGILQKYRKNNKSFTSSEDNAIVSGQWQINYLS